MERSGIVAAVRRKKRENSPVPQKKPPREAGARLVGWLKVEEKLDYFFLLIEMEKILLEYEKKLTLPEPILGGVSKPIFQF